MKCKTCGQSVSEERLSAMPDTDLCHGCSEHNRSRRCRRCREVVGEERAEALPETELCVACVKMVGPEFMVVARAVRTSKEGSMKINYGGVDVKLVRRQTRSL